MRRLALITLLLLAPVSLGATVLIPIEFRELVATAPVIVHGRVVDVRSEWIRGRRAVETFVTLQAEEYLKGNLGREVIFKVPGGQLGRYRTIFIGAPAFREGDEVVLFLKSSGPSFPFVIGLNQGVYRVLADARSGARFVRPPAVVGRLDGQAEHVVRGSQDRRPLTMDAFRAVVRRAMAGAR